MNRWVLSLACLFLFFPFASHADEQPRPSENASVTKLPFHLSSGYLIEVEGRLGGETRLRFILDTGASISIVDQRLVEKLKLDSRAARSFNFDRSLQWGSATVPEVQFGPIRAVDVAVLVGNLARYSEFAKKADAIIGMDLLQLSNVIVDFDAEVLLFDSTSRKPYAAGGDPMAKCLILALPVQDHLIHLIVDTGLQGILLYEDRLRKTLPGVRVTGRIQNATMGGRMQVKQATLPDAVFGSKHLDVPVLLAPSPSVELLPEIDGIVGVAALHAHRVRLDFVGKTISWE